MSDEKLLDLEAAAARFPGGRAMLPEMAEILLGEAQLLTTQMVEAFSTGNVEEVQRTAHTLKGAADLFGSDRVVATSRQIEFLARDGKLEEASALLGELQQRAGSLRDALREFLQARDV